MTIFKSTWLLVKYFTVQVITGLIRLIIVFSPRYIISCAIRELKII